MTDSAKLTFTSAIRSLTFLRHNVILFSIIRRENFRKMTEDCLKRQHKLACGSAAIMHMIKMAISVTLDISKNNSICIIFERSVFRENSFFKSCPYHADVVGSYLSVVTLLRTVAKTW